MFMNNELIEILSKLKAEESATKRALDKYYKDDKKREKLFYKLNQIKKKQEMIKFKIRLERQMNKDEKFR